jgi:hypothetical protein
LRFRRRVNVLMIVVLATGVILTGATMLAQISHAAGSGGWTGPRNLSQSGSGSSIGPDLGVDMQGAVHATWMTGTSPTKDLCYARSTDGGNTWPTCHVIDTGYDSSNGSLAVEADGTAHVAWWDRVGTESWLYYSSGTGTAWASPAALQTGGDISEPATAVANGIVHIVFSYKPGPFGSDLYYKRKYVTDTVWSFTTIISDTGYSSLHPSLDTDPAGDLHLAWHDEVRFPDETGLGIIYYMSGTVGPVSTEWSPAITVSNGITEATAPDVRVGSDYTVHLAFGERISDTEQYVYYVSFPAASPPDPVSATLVPGSQVDVSRLVPYYPSPSIALIGSTQVHLVWNGAASGDMSDRVYYAMSDDQGDHWSDPVAIARGTPSLGQGLATIASDGRVLHLAWQQSKSAAAYDIHYSRHFPFVRILPLGFKNYP